MMGKIIRVVLVVLVLSWIGWLTYLQVDDVKIVYVKSDQIFNEFTLTKDLNAKYMNAQNARLAMLDTMEMNIRAISFRLNSAQLKKAEDSYYIKKDEVERLNNELLETYNKQVWARINQYIIEFAEKNGYEIVLGASGNGTLMYAQKGMDVTTPFVEFMNRKYDGKN